MASKDQPHPRFDINSLKLNSELAQSRSAHQDCRSKLTTLEKENLDLKCRLSEVRGHNEVVSKLVLILSAAVQLLKDRGCGDSDDDDNPDEPLAVNG